MKPLDPRLLREVRSTRVILGATGLIGIALGLVLVAQAGLLASVVTAAFLDGADLAELRPELTLLAGAVVARAVLVGLRELLGRLTAGSVGAELRQRVLAHAVRLGPVGLARERRGELAAVATTGIEALDRYVAGYLPQLVLAMVVPLVVLVRLVPLDLTAVVIMVITLPIIPVFMVLVGRATEAQTTRRWKVLSRLSAHYLDVVEGLATLRAFGRASAQERTIAAVGDEYRRATMRTLRFSFLSALVLELVATLSVALVAVAVGLRVVEGDLALQPALTVLILAPEVYLPLRQVGARFHDSMAGLEACQRAFDLLAVTPLAAGQPSNELAHQRGATDLSARLRREPLVLDAVTFTYPDRPAPALVGVSLALAPGSTVAVVGRSGAGKSTLSSLLLRFADPTEGRLLVGSTDARTFAITDWHASVAWLPQRSHLLTASVADNVRLARPDATDDEVRAALAAAHVLDEVDALPLGIHTVLAEEGADLSAGQRRRVALARVFLRDAPLVVVDEPTANLDGESRRAVLDSLMELRSRCTLVVVAHEPLVPSDLVVDVVDGEALVGERVG